MAIYMKIPGVQGNVTAKGHEKWIEVKSLDFRVSNDVQMQTGKTFNRFTSVPDFKLIDLTKLMDQSSHLLFEHSCSGKVISTVEIHCCSTGSTMTPYAKYVFSNVAVASYAAITTGDQPVENIELGYTKVESTYQSRDASNKLSSPYTSGYDVEAAQMM